MTRSTGDSYVVSLRTGEHGKFVFGHPLRPMRPPRSILLTARIRSWSATAPMRGGFFPPPGIK